MKPGEVITVAPAATPVISSTATDAVADWVSNEFHFENTRLSEIAEMVYQRYGYQMKFDDDLLQNRSITGHLHATSLERLLNALEVTLNITIEKNGKELLVAAN